MTTIGNATLLTCLFLPALYAAWFKVKEDYRELPERRQYP